MRRETMPRRSVIGSRDGFINPRYMVAEERPVPLIRLLASMVRQSKNGSYRVQGGKSE